MSDTANDLNIDLITSSCISQESSGSDINDSIAANIDNIDVIANKLGGNYELANFPRILMPFSSCSSVGVEKLILKL